MPRSPASHWPPFKERGGGRRRSTCACARWWRRWTSCLPPSTPDASTSSTPTRPTTTPATNAVCVVPPSTAGCASRSSRRRPPSPSRGGLRDRPGTRFRHQRRSVSTANSAVSWSPHAHPAGVRRQVTKDHTRSTAVAPCGFANSVSGSSTARKRVSIVVVRCSLAGEVIRRTDEAAAIRRTNGTAGDAV